MAERMGDKRPLLWQRHRETPLAGAGSKHRRTLYSASQGGRRISGRQKDHRGMTAQQSVTETLTAQAREQQEFHAFKQGSNGAIVIREWMIRMGEKATSVDQSPKTRWDREDSVDIHRNRGLGNKRCVPTLPLAFELISSLIHSYNTRKIGEGKLTLTKIKFSLLVEGTQWKENKLS